MTTSAAVIVDAAAYAQAVQDAACRRRRLLRGRLLATGRRHVRPAGERYSGVGGRAPDDVLPDSPTGKVAGGAAEGDVPHTVPMLSLDNVFSPEEFTAWTASLARRLGREVTRFGVGPKLDVARGRRPLQRWPPHPADHPRVTARPARTSRTPSAPSRGCPRRCPSRSPWRCAARSS